MKRQPTIWKKIFANDATDNGLISNSIKKNKQSNQKTSRITEQTFFQRRETDGQKAHEKMLNIINYQVNANQNNNKISFHTCKNGYYKKPRNNKCWLKMWRQGNPCMLFVGI